MADASFLFWLLFLFLAFWPAWQQRQIAAARLRVLRRLELERGSRVITLIHRQEMLSFLGIPLRRYITVEDSEQVLRAVRLTPPDMPIDLILHTPGGLVLAAEQIARALLRHPAKVTVFVPHYAMSGGTLIALAADEIVMDENAVLGPVDPQIGQYPAASILEAVRRKDVNRVHDETLILADLADKALRQVEGTLRSVLETKFGQERARTLADTFGRGYWTHDFPLTVERLREMGLAVSTDLPPAVHQLMDLYPQPPQRRPSVQFVPLPYDGERR
ncbi:MAG: ATP-dependent Clp protease proteolytic subunit [Clostridia bacterium]|jgi:ClpP class serine protease|nr:ATP-dependent Clp protease proteolytic subunit [Clostridia bacterium]MDH7573383.1 ATP-dependent Clp protease proteolytic subunit [Clostridia bacterium]